MSERTRIVGCLMISVDGRTFATAVRHEMAYCPHCWRCGEQIFQDTWRLVPGDDLAHPWVLCCRGCVTPDDETARETQEGRGVR